MNIYRHGDLCIKQVKRLPEGLKEKKSNVLAVGETTGHAHVLQGERFKMYEKDNVLYLSVQEVTPLTHEEHKRIDIAPGEYIIQTEKEYNPFDDEINKVSD